MLAFVALRRCWPPPLVGSIAEHSCKERRERRAANTFQALAKQKCVVSDYKFWLWLVGSPRPQACAGCMPPTTSIEALAAFLSLLPQQALRPAAKGRPQAICNMSRTRSQSGRTRALGALATGLSLLLGGEIRQLVELWSNPSRRG